MSLTPLSSPPLFLRPPPPSRSVVTCMVVLPRSVSTLSGLLSVRTGRLPFLSLPSNITMWSFASLGVVRGLSYSGMSTRIMPTSIPRSVSCSLVSPMNLLITQVQKAISSGSKMQELNFNHPIKYLASAKAHTDGSGLDSMSLTMITSSSSRLTVPMSPTSSSLTPTTPPYLCTTTQPTPLLLRLPSPCSSTHSPLIVVRSSLLALSTSLALIPPVSCVISKMSPPIFTA